MEMETQFFLCVSLMTVYQLSSCGYESMAGAIPVGSIAIRTWKGVKNTL